MRRKVFAVLCIIGIIIAGSSVCFAQGTIVEMPEIKIIIDGEQKPFSDVPIVANSRTLLPLRQILVYLGVPNDDQHIIWDQPTQSVTVKHNGTEIYLKLYDNTAKVNGRTVTLDVQSTAYKNRTYIPARFVSEVLNKKVEWDGRIKAVYITNNDVYQHTSDTLGMFVSSMRNVTDCAYTVKCNIKLAASSAPKPDEYVYSTNARSDFFANVTHVVFKGPAQRGADFEVYYALNRVYTKMAGGEWVSDSFENGNIIGKMGLLGKCQSVGDEFACVGLKADDALSNDKEAALKGELLFEPASAQIGFLLGSTSTVLDEESGYITDIKKTTTTIYFDKLTNRVNKILANVTGVVVGNSGKRYSLNADVAYEFSGYNQGIKLEVPSAK